MKILRNRSMRSMPWKNGLGTTKEIAIFPAGANLTNGDFQWRLSLSEVRADGPFSTFPQCDRLLVVWKGNGFFLNDLRVDPMKPVRFAGEFPASVTMLDHSVMDLGLIFKRDEIDAEMRTFDFGSGANMSTHEIDLKPGTHFLFCTRGEIEIGFHFDAKTGTLKTKDAVEFVGEQRIHLVVRHAEVSPQAVLVSIFRENGLLK